jgi:hypothetical protein
MKTGFFFFPLRGIVLMWRCLPISKSKVVYPESYDSRSSPALVTRYSGIALVKSLINAVTPTQLLDAKARCVDLFC